MKRSMGWQPDRDTKEHVARLRGLPYDTEKRDIYAFFSGKRIHMHFLTLRSILPGLIIHILSAACSVVL